MTGAIHDLGYKRYLGTRRPQSTRWRVIMRHQLATAWKSEGRFKGWWRYKAWLGLSVMGLVVFAAVMYFWQTKMVPMFGGGADKVRWLDLALPFAEDAFRTGAMFLTFTVGASVIASDAQSGAFVFYFSRPVRPVDYLAGKVAAMVLLMATLVALPLLLIAGLRVGLAGSTHEMVDSLDLLPRALAVGLIDSVAYAVVPLGISALVQRPLHALAAWAGYYLLIGSALAGAGAATGSPIGALSLSTACSVVANAIFDSPLPMVRRVLPPLGPSVASLVGHLVLALGLAYWRVRQAQRTGVGGGS